MEKFDNTSLGAHTSQRFENVRALYNYWNTVKRVLIDNKKTEEDPDFTLIDVMRGDTEILSTEIDKQVRDFFVYVLELLECGLADDDPRIKELYKQLRPKILRGGNDVIRNLQKVLGQYHILKIIDTKEIFRFEGKV